MMPSRLQEPPPGSASAWQMISSVPRGNPDLHQEPASKRRQSIWLSGIRAEAACAFRALDECGVQRTTAAGAADNMRFAFRSNGGEGQIAAIRRCRRHSRGSWYFPVERLQTYENRAVRDAAAGTSRQRLKSQPGNRTAAPNYPDSPPEPQTVDRISTLSPVLRHRRSCGTGPGE